MKEAVVVIVNTEKKEDSCRQKMVEGEEEEKLKAGEFNEKLASLAVQSTR